MYKAEEAKKMKKQREEAKKKELRQRLLHWKKLEKKGPKKDDRQTA